MSPNHMFRDCWFHQNFKDDSGTNWIKNINRWDFSCWTFCKWKWELWVFWQQRQKRERRTFWRGFEWKRRKVCSPHKIGLLIAWRFFSAIQQVFMEHIIRGTTTTIFWHAPGHLDLLRGYTGPMHQGRLLCFVDITSECVIQWPKFPPGKWKRNI